MEEQCFVIQPFDDAEFDKRFDDIIAPSLERANISAYRVDRDPNVTIPIQDIENGIRKSRLCLAEITSDNPNVWFELGFALALHKDVILVCNKSRGKFPFDIQHRKIITYQTESSSDFERLSNLITERASAILSKQDNLGKIADLANITKSDGMRSHEIAALASVMQNQLAPEELVSTYQITNDMSSAGFNQLATSIALTSLRERQYVAATQDEDYNGEKFWAYRITESGVAWLLSNQQDLDLRLQPPKQMNVSFDDDDIPF